MTAEPIRYFKPTDRAYFGHDLLLIPRDGSRWGLGLTFEVDFKGQRRRAAMRTAYRAKTKHRRRKR